MGIRIASVAAACALSGACGDDSNLEPVEGVPATLLNPTDVVGRQLGEGGSTGLIYHIGP